MATRRKSLAEALGREHAVLVEQLLQLEQAAGLPPEEGEPRVRSQLARVGEHLLKHFRFEEENGYMDEALAHQPRLERVGQQLFAEHRQLADGLVALLAEADGGHGGDPSFGAKVRAWLDQVRQHEHREVMLIEDAFCLDIGTKD
jgi:hypothetical protein